MEEAEKTEDTSPKHNFVEIVEPLDGHRIGDLCHAVAEAGLGYIKGLLIHGETADIEDTFVTLKRKHRFDEQNGGSKNRNQHICPTAIDDAKLTVFG